MIKLGEDNNLYTKPNSSVKRTKSGDYVKKINYNELMAYEYLNANSKKLVDNEFRIKVPEVLSCDFVSMDVTLESLGGFPNLSPSNYFGEWSGYTKQYLSTITKTFEFIRKMPMKNFPNKVDYEKVYNGESGSIEYIRSGMVGADISKCGIDLLDRIEELNKSSYGYIYPLPQFPAHRDPNPNNYLIDYSSIVRIVDWETFGLARRGYDEARQLSYLVLNRAIGQWYEKFCEKRFADDAVILYFWQVASMRVFREINSFEGQHYDVRLANAGENKEYIVSALYKFLEYSIAKWDQVLSRVAFSRV